MADNELFRVLGGLSDFLFQAYVRIGVHPWCTVWPQLPSWKPIWNNLRYVFLLFYFGGPFWVVLGADLGSGIGPESVCFMLFLRSLFRPHFCWFVAPFWGACLGIFGIIFAHILNQEWCFCIVIAALRVHRPPDVDLKRCSTRGNFFGPLFSVLGSVLGSKMAPKRSLEALKTRPKNVT